MNNLVRIFDGEHYVPLEYLEEKLAALRSIPNQETKKWSVKMNYGGQIISVLIDTDVDTEQLNALKSAIESLLENVFGEEDTGMDDLENKVDAAWRLINRGRD